MADDSKTDRKRKRDIEREKVIFSLANVRRDSKLQACTVRLQLRHKLLTAFRNVVI